MTKPYGLGMLNGAGVNISDFTDRWTVDHVNKRVITSYTVQSGLNSFRWGDMHEGHSASENLFTENKVSHINFFPVWQGVLPFIEVGQAMTLNPTSRQYTKPFELLTNGAVSTANNVVYTASVTLQQHESILRLEIEAGEAYDGVLTYNIRNVDINGLVKYTQERTVNSSIGDLITFEFTYQGDDSPFAYGHPSENRTGSTIHVSMTKEDGTEFLVKAGTNTSLPWLRLTLMNFQDVEVSSGVIPVDESQDILYSSQYAVDTSLGQVDLLVDISTGLESFTVFDSNQNFNQSSCIVDFNDGNTATLQTKNDSFLFYKVGNVWKYLDLNTKNGGIV